MRFRSLFDDTVRVLGAESMVAVRSIHNMKYGSPLVEERVGFGGSRRRRRG